MTMTTLISDSIATVINKLPDTILSIATVQTGIEEIIYPYFNVELMRHYNLDKIAGIGYGKLSANTGEKIDCLIITTTKEKVAVEFKGPSQTAFLLAGASGAYKDTDGMSACLKTAYNENGNTAEIHPDSHVGDTLKLIKLINKGELNYAFSIGILKYTETTASERDKYLRKLQKMLSCFKNMKFISLNLSWRNIDDKSVFLSVIEITPKTS